MSRLTFKEFIKLPREEQNERYKELSDHDKFLARMNDVGTSSKFIPLTDEEISKLPPDKKDILERIKNQLLSK